MTNSAYTLDEVSTRGSNFEVGKKPTHWDVHWAKVSLPTGWTDLHPWNAYARAKAACTLFAVAVVDNLGTKGVTSFAVDPGSKF